MNPAPAQPARIRVDAVLRNALRAFVAFPAPGLAYFAVLVGWDCYNNAANDFDPVNFALLGEGPQTLDIMLWFAGTLLVYCLMCRLTRVAIAGVRGERATWNDTTVSLWKYFHAVTAWGAWLTLALLGLLFFIVPGVLALLAWSQAFYCAIDRRERWTAALGHSRELTKGHHAEILGVGFAMVMLLLPGEILAAAALRDSASQLEELFGSGLPLEAHATAAALDPAAFATALLGAVLSGAAYTAMSYVGAALYVALHDASTDAGLVKAQSEAGRARPSTSR